MYIEFKPLTIEVYTCFTCQELRKLAQGLHLKLCANFVQTFNKLTADKEYISRFALSKSGFIRNRYLPFRQLVLFLMGFNTTSLSKELRRFFENSMDGFSSVTKSALSQARQKLNPACLIDLNNTLINLYYGHEMSVIKWRKYRLLSIDGSTLHLPKSQSVSVFLAFCWDTRKAIRFCLQGRDQ